MMDEVGAGNLFFTRLILEVVVCPAFVSDIQRPAEAAITFFLLFCGLFC